MACRSPLRPRSAVTAEWGAKASTGVTRRQIGPFAGSGPSDCRVPTTSRRRGRDVIAFPNRVTDTYDVAVIGAGVAGLTSAVFLRRAGLRVVCVDTRAYPHHKVGESLDWSSPNMLQRVGIGAREPDRRSDRHLQERHRGLRAGQTGLGRAAATEHHAVTAPVRDPDATRRSHRARSTAVRGGARTWNDVRLGARDGRRRGRRSRARMCHHQRATHQARHYIDASGTALVFARAMGIPTQEYGRTKVCLWTYFKTPPLQRATTFFLDSRDDYLSWIWDIPISPTETSVGFVATADAIKSERRAGRSVRRSLRLSSHATSASTRCSPSNPSSTSKRPRSVPTSRRAWRARTGSWPARQPRCRIR